MSEEVYAIINLEGYAAQMRSAAAKSLSDDPEDQLDDYISIGQIINMVNQECVGFDEEDRPLLDENANETIFENTAIWIHNVGLAKLAALDLVECAWDNEYNDMVFWAKDTQPKNDKRKRRRKNKKSEG
jgi:hypothetical protein